MKQQAHRKGSDKKIIEILSTSLPSSQFPSHQFRPREHTQVDVFSKVMSLVKYGMFLGQEGEPNSPLIVKRNHATG